MDNIQVQVLYTDKYDLENWGPLKYAHEGDAGFDFRSILNDVILHPGQRMGAATGVKMMIPYGYHLEIRPRSGLAFKNGLTVLNAPGTIDSGYIGEIQIILINHGHDLFRVGYGERIAQGVLIQHVTPEFVRVETLEKTSRGDGKYGSTGSN